MTSTNCLTVNLSYVKNIIDNYFYNIASRQRSKATDCISCTYTIVSTLHKQDTIEVYIYIFPISKLEGLAIVICARQASFTTSSSVVVALPYA
ncbi:MAG: hypothetical protein CMK81_05440 [Pseudomonadales bacterium]|nr:hypothetical protein [Pseudomonadales bacterium]